MKKKKIALLYLFATLTFEVFTPVSVNAQSKNEDFFCGTKNGSLVTKVRAETGHNKVIVYWRSNRLAGNLTPQERCEKVSNNFQKALDQQLFHLVSNEKNGEQVLCASSRKHGTCELVLLTLKPGSNARNILREMFDLRGLANGKAIEESKEKNISVDFLMYLKGTPVE
jgi:hypothetical protein